MTDYPLTEGFINWANKQNALREQLERSLVVEEAKTWVGTPYHHCADIKGVGVDCAMLLVRIVVDTGLVPAFDPRPYPPDWHLHRSEELYLHNMSGRAKQVVTPKAGDFVVWKWGRTFSHGGVVMNDEGPLDVVHALSREKIVMRGAPPGYLNGHEVRYYSMWADQ